MSIDDDLIFAHRLADAAGEAIRPFFRRKIEVIDKGAGIANFDPVTQADKGAEAAIRALLKAERPDDGILGEEFGEERGSSGRVWVIDPVDGTANFAEGREEFCVMLALLERDQVLGGWIYDPVTDRTSYAVRGAGAWSGGQRLAPPKTPNEHRGILAVGYKGDRQMAQRVQQRRARVHQVKSIRCAGLEYLRLARGEVDFLLFGGAMPWDHAPGAAIIQELGGYISYVDGKGFRPSGALQAGGILAARDRATWDEIHHRLLGDA